MKERSKDSDNKPDFTTLIPGYSDMEIVDILKKRNLYQPEAADLAIKEAIKRGIINSEQDLFSDEFRAKPIKNTFFPVIENKIQRKKISKSIIRGLIISGAIPAVYGAIQLFDANFSWGLAITSGGIIWLVLAILLLREIKQSIINMLLVLAVFSLVCVIYLLLANSILKWMDYVIPVIFYFLIFYGLVFLKKINS